MDDSGNSDLQQMLEFQRQQILVKKLMDSGLGRAAFAGVAGMGFGMLMSLIFSRESVGILGNETDKMTWGQAFRYHVRNQAARSWSLGKSFGIVGFLYAGTETAVETVR